MGRRGFSSSSHAIVVRAFQTTADPSLVAILIRENKTIGKLAIELFTLFTHYRAEYLPKGLEKMTYSPLLPCPSRVKGVVSFMSVVSVLSVKNFMSVV